MYFTETGFIHFASNPAHELFNLSVSLEDIFTKNDIRKVEDKLAIAPTDKQRIKIVEAFLLAQLKHIEIDKLILEAVKLIYQSKGAMGWSRLAGHFTYESLIKQFGKIGFQK